VEDVGVDKAGEVPCLRMDWGLAAGDVLPLGGALGVAAAVLTVEESGVAAAERAAGAAEAATGRAAAVAEGATNCFPLNCTPLGSVPEDTVR